MKGKNGKYDFANTISVIKQIYHVWEGYLLKNTSLETKFPSPFGSGNFSSLDWYFSQIPLPNMIYYPIHK
jgi:hypothetical protein